MGTDDDSAVLVGWLTDGRPRCGSRAVFVTMRRPYRQLTPEAVRAVMGRACDRAGLERRGSHRFRHALATEMLRMRQPLAPRGAVGHCGQPRAVEGVGASGAPQAGLAELGFGAADDLPGGSGGSGARGSLLAQRAASGDNGLRAADGIAGRAVPLAAQPGRGHRAIVGVPPPGPVVRPSWLLPPF